MASRVALIFGISGQTGSYLASLLTTLGYTVHGTSRDHETTSFSNLERLGCRKDIQLHSLSLFDTHGILRLLRDLKPDEVYNLAGQSSVALSFDQPVATFESIAVGALNILESLRLYSNEIRFFNATSTDCFGNIEPGSRATETTPFHPKSPYAMAKAASFWAVASYRQSYGLFTCNGILSNHESPLRPDRFVTRKIVNAAVRISQGSNERLKLGDLSVERDWGWAPDFASAIWKTVQHKTADDFLIATGTTMPLQAFAEGAFAYFGLDWREHVDISQNLYRPSDIPRVALDSSKAKDALGWQARIAMPALIQTMIECELDGGVGPLPWK